MSVNSIFGQSETLYGYQDFSVQCFDSIDAFTEYAELAKSKGDQQLFDFLDTERRQIDNELQTNRDNQYGLRGTFKAPISYQDALDRNSFVYEQEYKRAKEKAKYILDKALEKNSLAKAMQPKMIFTDRELGEFVYERAAMSIKPNLFYYSFIHKEEVSEKDIDFMTVNDVELFKYKKDGSEILLCVKVTYFIEDEEKKYDEYYEAKNLTDEDLEGFVEKGGVLSISSNVKKVYEFKEKQPKIKNAVKIFIATTVGGFTKQSVYGDFYTGITAVMLTEYLEQRDYSVELVMVLGGGRCGGRGGTTCVSLGYPLNTPSGYGRRFIGITVKKFEEQLDTDKLLYWTADPSALKIKLLRYFNVFFWLYGDVMTYSSTFWHGIEDSDLVCPIGTYYKNQDIKDGNKDLLYFSIRQVKDEDDVARSINKIITQCENINFVINQKAINKV